MLALQRSGCGARGAQAPGPAVRGSLACARAAPRPAGLPRAHDASPQELLASALAAPLAALVVAGSLLLPAPPPAHAVLSSPNARIARTPEAALRRSIPAANPEVKDIQERLESTSYLLRIPQRKPYGTMARDIEQALSHFEPNKRPKLLVGVPDEQRAEADKLLTDLYSVLRQVELAVSTQQADFVGVRAATALQLTARLELLQAPGLPYILPKEYASYPRLAGRSVVQMEVERRDGSLSFVDTVNGGLTSRGIIEITVDGFSAPLSAGRFVQNVLAGAYDGRAVEEGQVAVTIPTPPAVQAAPIPLEVMAMGDYQPSYRLPLDIQGGEMPVLPLSIQGSVAFAHNPESSSYSSGDSFFMYRFSSQQAGLGGLAFDEGGFSVFGYVTRGLDVMRALHSGDVILTARVVSGADKLQT